MSLCGGGISIDCQSVAIRPLVEIYSTAKMIFVERNLQLQGYLQCVTVHLHSFILVSTGYKKCHSAAKIICVKYDSTTNMQSARLVGIKPSDFLTHCKTPITMNMHNSRGGVGGLKSKNRLMAKFPLS